MNELLKRGKEKEIDNYKFLRYILIAKDDYVSICLLDIGFHYKFKKEIKKLEKQRIR